MSAFPILPSVKASASSPAAVQIVLNNFIAPSLLKNASPKPKKPTKPNVPEYE